MSVNSAKLIILDRDGVINEDRDDYVKSADEWIPLPGSLEAIALLNQAGYQITIATNQSGLARGYFTIDELHAMHRKMNDLLKPLGGHIDSIFFCVCIICKIQDVAFCAVVSWRTYFRRNMSGKY